MKKYLYYSFVFFLFLAVSCQTLDQITIDYLVPSEVSFPKELRRVGIVNNSSLSPERKELPKNDPKEGKNELTRLITYPEGDTMVATEILAESIAAENYFEKVVICDSALRSKDHFPRETILSKEEVVQLTEELDVDFLLSLESLSMKSVRTVRFQPEWGVFEGVVDIQVQPVVRAYLPNRTNPMVAVTCRDSIFWQEFGTTETYVRSHLIDDKKVVEEASVFAGTVPVQKLIPYWKSVYRYYYGYGSVQMRDAKVYINKEDWDNAHTLWLQAYESPKKKQKMRAAFNIALYHEMNDEIEEAEIWLLKAQELAREIDKVEKKSQGSRIEVSDVPNYALTVIYMQDLQERKNNLAKLRVQMQRFDNE